MSRRWLPSGLALTALMVLGCGARLAAEPRAAGPQATNAEAPPKKKPKRPPPLVAPPPAYGNKIVRDHSTPLAISTEPALLDG